MSKISIRYDDTTNAVMAGAATLVAVSATLYVANLIKPLRCDSLKGDKNPLHKTPEEVLADKLSEKVYAITMDFYKEIQVKKSYLYTDVDKARVWALKQETPLAGNPTASTLWKSIMEIAAILTMCARNGSLILDYTYCKKASATTVTVLIYDMVAEFVHLTCIPNSPIRYELDKMSDADKTWLNKTLRAVELFRIQLIDDYKHGRNGTDPSPIMTLLRMNKDELSHFAPFKDMCDNAAITNEKDFIIWDPSTSIYADAETLMDKLYQRFLDPEMNRRYKRTVDELTRTSRSESKESVDGAKDVLKKAFSFAVDVVSDVTRQSERVNQFADIVMATSGIK